MKLMPRLLLAATAWIGCASAGAQQPLIEASQTVTLVASDSAQLLNPIPCPVDSNWVAYSRLVQNRKELHFFHRGDSTFRFITSSPAPAEGEVDLFSAREDKGCDDQLDWCPVKRKGKIWFAFIGSGPSSNPDVYVANLDDLKPFRLTDQGNEQFTEYHPRWSPDGRDLVFGSSRTGGGDLYLISSVFEYLDKPPVLRRLTVNDGEDLFPAWCPAPRSGLLAYTAYQKGAKKGRMGLAINLIDLARGGSVATASVNENFDCFRPSWDPLSGDRIAYYASKLPENQIGQVDASIFESNIGLLELKPDEQGGFTVQQVVGQGQREFAAGKVLTNLYSGPTWVTGSQCLLAVKRLEDQFTPLYAVNLKTWQLGFGRVEEPLNLKAKFPRDPVMLNNLLFAGAQDGNQYQITAARLQGRLVSNLQYHHYTLDGRMPPPPSDGGIWSFLTSPLLLRRTDILLNRPIVGGPVLAAVVYIIATGGDDGPGRVPIPMPPYPPGMP
ncbi:MAG: hypothetical protein C4524_14970 [Candidatus Zixiibacteriota bacterium]|nr:MAG: hypothetical protein C4524_14970 [candidate division Zixibacteria bacterium]